MMRHYIDELVKEGKLQPTIEFDDRPERQQYITTGSDFNVFSEQALLDFCKTPKRSREIAKHFAMTYKKLFPFLDGYLKACKLKIVSITQNTTHRKYMTIG